MDVIESQELTSGFAVHLDNFDGPFDLLLQLISRHKLDVTEVSLSLVTDEFIGYIRKLEESGEGWQLDQATEFLVVAATLLDLKAAKLLPQGEVEDEADLALLEARDLLFARLLQYRAFKEIAATFSERISLAEQSQFVINALRLAKSLSFRSLVHDASEPMIVVARFLALLDLYRTGSLRFEQLEAFTDLQITWIGAESGDIAISDEFDTAVNQSEEEGSDE